MRAADVILLLACALLALSGPAMAYQEWTRAEDARTTRELTGETPPLDASFRLGWRLPLLALLFVVGALATFTLVSTVMDPALRPLTTRLVALLLTGMLLADVAFLLDGTLFQDAPHAARALTLVWLYPAGAVLIAGSAHRLAEVREMFGSE